MGVGDRDGGAEQPSQPMAPFPQGRFSESLVNQPLSEFPLCYFTVTTVTGSGEGGAAKKKKRKRQQRDKKGERRSQIEEQLVAAAQLKLLIRVWKATRSLLMECSWMNEGDSYAQTPHVCLCV